MSLDSGAAQSRLIETRYEASSRINDAGLPADPQTIRTDLTVNSERKSIRHTRAELIAN